MQEQLQKRLPEPKTEFESGQKRLVDTEVKQANLRNTLLRISRAIQVLEEELAKANPPTTGSEVEQLNEQDERVIKPEMVHSEKAEKLASRGISMSRKQIG